MSEQRPADPKPTSADEKRCKWCGKVPRSREAKENFAKRYPGFCSYDHRERHNLQEAYEYLRSRGIES